MYGFVGLARNMSTTHDRDGEKERGTTISLNHNNPISYYRMYVNGKISGCTTVYGNEILKLTGVIAVEEEDQDLVRIGCTPLVVDWDALFR
jgi:hypothetical protein